MHVELSVPGPHPAVGVGVGVVGCGLGVVVSVESGYGDHSIRFLASLSLTNLVSPSSMAISCKMIRCRCLRKSCCLLSATTTVLDPSSGYQITALS